MLKLNSACLFVVSIEADLGGIWCHHSYFHADIQAIATYYGIRYILEVMTGAKDKEARYFQHLSLCREIDYTQRVGYALKQCRQY